MKFSLPKRLRLAITSSIIATLTLGSFHGEAANKLNFSEEELAYMPATQQIELFQKGDLAPIDVLNAQIARVEKYNGEQNTERVELKDYLRFNGKVNAIVFDKFAEAKAQAIEAERRYQNGTARPLEGITVGIKADPPVAGWVVDCGSLLLKDHPPASEDAAIIDKLNAAGAIKVFSTTVPEFYISSMTWSRLYGVTRNPWNLSYGVGGSSGGSGAALAAGFCTLATGSDMGGSIRIPASMNGIYGFKAPFGRVASSNTQFETQGAMAKNFPDLVLMQNVITGPSKKVMAALSPKLDYPLEYEDLTGTKIAVCFLDGWADVANDQATVDALNRTIAKLRQAGAQVDVITSLSYRAEDLLPTYINGLLSTELYSMVSLITDDNFSKLCTYSQSLLADRSAFSSDATVKIDNLRKKLHRDIQEEVFEKGYLALVTPTLITANVPADVDATPDKLPISNGQTLPSSQNIYTFLWNILDRYPVVDVPAGFSAHNVPIGVQVIANTYADLDAFRVAAALAKANDEADDTLYINGKFPDFRQEQ